MKKITLFLILLFLISCNTQKLSRILENNLKVYNVAKKQLILFNQFQRADTFTLNKFLIDSIYIPNSTFWDGYLGDEKAFLNWSNKKGIKQLSDWNKKLQIINPDFLTLKLKEIAVKMYKFTGYAAKGNWYIIYGPGWANLGGFEDGTMFIDLAHKTNENSEKIIWLYPHELNHQIYSNTLKFEEDIVLNRIIDEGFATYISYLFHEKKYSIAEELMYSIEDYEFCVKNEKELLLLMKDNYYKSDEKLSRQFASREYKFKDNYPEAIGYYLGFRIVEEYVKQNGKDSWKQIYTIQPAEVLTKSKILKYL